MLKSQLLHPQILESLGRAGHTSRILIADGNYPASTTLGPNAKLVSLNLSPGVVSCTDVLTSLISAVPVEQANVMAYASEGSYALDADPPIWNDYRSIFNQTDIKLELEPIERFAFYDTARQPDVALVIATADQRVYANLLLTIGVVFPNKTQ